MVYVDNSKVELSPRVPRDRRSPPFIFSRLSADSDGELISMLRDIEVDAKWIQRSASGKALIQICQSKRRLAISFGAAEISKADMDRMQD